MKYLVLAIAAAALAGCGKPGAAANEPAAGAEARYQPTAQQKALAEPPSPIKAVMPEMNARRGRILFVSKGCVICHAVNGVGGKAAPDLSTTIAAPAVNPLDFSARMWRGAPAMTALQQVELGYVINLDGQDIADLAAFVSSPGEQSLLTADSVSDEMRSWFLDAPQWRSDDWEEFRGRGDKIPFDDGEDHSEN